MPSDDRTPGERRPPARKPWVTPKLERFGTLVELTRGASGKKFDGGHPPGQSKSRM